MWRDSEQQFAALVGLSRKDTPTWFTAGEGTHMDRRTQSTAAVTGRYNETLLSQRQTHESSTGWFRTLDGCFYL